MTKPLVTVNILSYNRINELRTTLTKVYAQDYKNIEVIVVDNASSDGTQEMVRDEFPAVKLIELTENIGIAGWNKGFEIAKGEYVLVLDDDSYPEDSSLLYALYEFHNNKKVGVVAFAIRNEKWGGFENPEYENPELLTFTGCGALIKKSVFDKVGMFQSLLFIYLHELEFSMRLLDNDFVIVYSKEAQVVHNYSEINRGESLSYRYDSRKDFFFFRNRIIIFILHFSITTESIVLIFKIIKMLLNSIVNKTFTIKLKALNSIINNFRNIISIRKPLSKKTQYIYLKNHF